MTKKIDKDIEKTSKDISKYFGLSKKDEKSIGKVVETLLDLSETINSIDNKRLRKQSAQAGMYSFLLGIDGISPIEILGILELTKQNIIEKTK